MAKRSGHKAKSNKSIWSYIANYLKKYLLVISVGFLFFVGTKVILFTTHSTAPTCANSKSCTSDLSVHIDNNAIGYFEGKKVVPPKINLSDVASVNVLGSQTGSGEKHIYVDLSTQTLYAYEGDTLFMKTFIASGKWGKTPVGNFNIWEKLISTRMEGGEGADAYDLPNVPYVMYFHNDFGLHGAYWHDNFGHTMSHGCVNMRQIDAKALFEWADGPSGTTPGTPVSICNSIQNNRQCIQDNPIQ